jgi:microcystin-dependent protein
MSTIRGPFSVCKDVDFHGNLKVRENVKINKKLNVKKTATFCKDLHVKGNTIVDGDYIVNDPTNSTAPNNGAMVVEGGLGVGMNLNVGGEMSLDGDLNVGGNISAGERIFQAGNLLMPVGSLLPYAGSTTPGGYLLCDGSNVSRTTYSDLFSVISTTYGVGDGSTTFTLPNLTGRVILGTSGSFPLGTQGGSETVALTIGNMPSHSHMGTTDADGLHSHTVNDPGHAHSQINGRDDGNISNVPGQAPPGDGAPNVVGAPTESATTGISISSAGSHTHTFTTGTTGSGTSFSVLNPYLSLNYIIKF